MPFWLVKATWIEDESDAASNGGVNADTVYDAVKAVTTHLRFHPHHVEARRCEPEEAKIILVADLSPGEARRVPQ
jgi:hypothetical protein